MSQRPRSLFDEILEFAVYVPAGIAAKVLEQVPELAEAGRRRVGGQIDQARVIGRFAVGLARSRRRRPSAPGARAGSRSAPERPAHEHPAPERPAPEHPAPERAAPQEPAAGHAAPGPSSPTRGASAPPGARGRPERHAVPTPTQPRTAERPGATEGRGAPPAAPRGRPAAGEPGQRPDGSARRPEPPQAIPDYDALAASQVVPRLQGLDREELSAVERYEAATRGRRTILNRVAQLQRALDAD